MTGPTAPLETKMKPIAPSSTAVSALLGALVATTLVLGAAQAQAQMPSPGLDEGLVQPAQFYDPLAGGGEVYIDEYGRRVTIDGNGRIVGVEQPRRDRFNARRQWIQNRGAIIDAPPPPGVTVEGPVFSDQQGGFYDPGFDANTDPRAGAARDLPVDPGFGNGGGYDDRRVYREGPNGDYPNNGGFDQPVEASPLPQPGLQQPGTGDPSRQAAVPGPADNGAFGNTPGGGLGLPEPGASIIQPNGLPAEGQTVGESDPAPKVATPKGKNAKAEIAALQILLDRAGMSPGVIDGQMGSNVDKAVAAYTEKTGRTLPTGDARALAEELDATGGPAITTYEITSEDAAGPYVASIPSDYAEKASLPAMSFERPSERLAEKFHMDEAYLNEINPGADLGRQGTVIKVASIGPNVSGEVVRILADKGREQVRAYGADGMLIAAYPSTIGSSDTPSPTGTVQVNRIAFNPNYTYNPKINFKQGTNDKVLTIPPGPNGPVGSIWIALSKPTYGIHGTPEPSKIGKTNSHGCVRLTNWDAAELAKIVKPGVTVEFVE